MNQFEFASDLISTNWGEIRIKIRDFPPTYYRTVINVIITIAFLFKLLPMFFHFILMLSVKYVIR